MDESNVQTNAGEGSSSKGKGRAEDIDRVAMTDQACSDSRGTESEPESSGQFVFLDDHQKKMSQYEAKLQESTAEKAQLEKALVGEIVNNRGTRDLQVIIQATTQHYATTDTDRVSTQSRSYRPRNRQTFNQRLRAKDLALKARDRELEAERQKNAEEQARHLAREQELEERAAELRKALEVQEKEEALRLAREGKQVQRATNNERSMRTSDDPQVRLERQDSLVNNPAHSPLERIKAYFSSLENQNLVKQTVLYLLTGIVLRHKKTGQELPDLLDEDAVNIYKLIETVHGFSSRYVGSERGELRRHFEIMKACLEGIGPGSEISDINETILAAIKCRFFKNQKGEGELGVLLRDEMEGPIRDYFIKQYRNSDDDGMSLLECCAAILLATNHIPELQKNKAQERARKASEPVHIKESWIEAELQKLALKFGALYKKYDGLQLRNKNGSALERINDYFDSLENENLIKKTILELFTGMVLRSKKAGEPLPVLPDQDIWAIHELVERGIRAVDSLNAKDTHYWDLNMHYRRIKNCFKSIGPESDIQHINAIIVERIRQRFYNNNVQQLTDELMKIIQQDPSYLASKHIHSEVCQPKEGNFFVRTFFPGNRIACAQQELKKLMDKLNGLYTRFIDPQRRQSIRSQKMTDRELANQLGESSSSRQGASEHLHITASVRDPLLSQSTATISNYGSNTRQENAEETERLLQEFYANSLGAWLIA